MIHRSTGKKLIELLLSRRWDVTLLAKSPTKNEPFPYPNIQSRLHVGSAVLMCHMKTMHQNSQITESCCPGTPFSFVLFEPQRSWPCELVPACADSLPPTDCTGRASSLGMCAMASTLWERRGTGIIIVSVAALGPAKLAPVLVCWMVSALGARGKRAAEAVNLVPGSL